MPPMKNKVGNKYEKLTVTKMLPNHNNSGQVYCLCDCDCGTKNICVLSKNLSYTHPVTKSCGCVKNSHSNWTIEDIQQKIDSLYGQGEYKIISEEYVNSKIALDFIHMKCGYKFSNTLSNMYKTNAKHCPYCAATKIITGLNDLWTLRPDVANMLVNKELGYHVGIYDKNKTDFICPYCNTICEKSINTVTLNGLVCDACSDNISFPNKTIFYLLSSIGEDFRREVSFQWLPKKRYDVVIENKKLIVEMDGGLGHGNRSFTNESTYGNDSIKDEMAKRNGYTIIRIDCDYINEEKNRNDFIKNHIINSDLSKYYDLANVNWNEIFKLAEKNIFREIIDDFNNGMFKCDIAEKYKIHRKTVGVYIKRGVEMKLCVDNDIRKNKKQNAIKINQFNTNHDFIQQWESITEAAQFNKISVSSISSALHGYTKTSGGYIWEYANRK